MKKTIKGLGQRKIPKGRTKAGLVVGAAMVIIPIFFRKNANIDLGFSFYWWQVAIFASGLVLFCRSLKALEIDKLKAQQPILKAFYQNKDVVSYEQLAYFMKMELIQIAALLEKFAKNQLFSSEKIDREKQLLWPRGEVAMAEMPKATTVLLAGKKRSPYLSYAIGFTWLLYAFAFPLYRIGDFLAVIGISALIYLYARILWGSEVVFEEKTLIEAMGTGNLVVDEFIQKSHQFLEETKVISQKLGTSRIGKTLEETIVLAEKLFEGVEMDDQKIRKLQPFIDYYLPTTIKILLEYDKISHLPRRGENVSQMMSKIEGVMEKVKKAFAVELDRMYGENTLDIDAEITVLDHMIETEILNKSSK